MNTDELIVMGVLMILAGGLMVAKHLINNIPSDRPHSLPVLRKEPAPMATYSADSPLARNPKEEPGDYRPVSGPAASPAHIQQMATIKQRIFAQDRRIGKLEERHHYHVERQVLDYEALERRIAKLED